MSAVIVLPSIVPAYTQDCLATLHPSIIRPADLPTPPLRQWDPVIQAVTNGPNRLVVVWNKPVHQLGVAGSWNVGVKEVLRSRSDWLVILSAAVRFGPEGGRDFLDHLRAYQHADPPVLGVEAGDGLGWHLIAFPRHVLEKIGRFDTIFHPAYFEDNDWSIRIQRAYDRDTHAPGFVGPLWPKVDVDASLIEIAHGIRHSGVTVDMGALKALLDKKWGPDESYRTPYDDPELDYTFTGPHA